MDTKILNSGANSAGVVGKSTQVIKQNRAVVIIDKIIAFIRRIPPFGRLPVNFYRFFIVGITGFLFDFIVLQIAYFGFGVRERWTIWQITEEVVLAFSIANIISVFLGAIFGYILNKFWSFEDNQTDNVTAQFTKYLLVAIVNGILNNIFFGLLYYEVFSSWGLPSFISLSIAKFLSTSFQVVTSYLMYKYVIFVKDKEVITESTLP